MMNKRCSALLIAFLMTTSVVPQLANAASDNAGNPPYADGWQTGDNGGSGFGAWTLSATGAGVNSIDFPPDNADNQLGAPAFSLASDNRPFFFDTNDAKRSFTGGLGVGNTFSIDVDGAVLKSSGGGFDAGSAIALQNATGEELLSLYNNESFLSNRWLVSDGGTNNNAQTLTDVEAAQGFNLKMSISSASTYALKVTPFDPTVNGGLPYLFSGNLKSPAGGQAVDQLRIFTYGTGLANPLYVNNLQTTPGVVPEPSSIALLLLGSLAGIRCAARRKM